MIISKHHWLLLAEGPTVNIGNRYRSCARKVCHPYRGMLYTCVRSVQCRCPAVVGVQ